MLKLVVTCMEPDALRALLCAGDRNAGMTPLHWACHSNKRCMVNFLLSCGASPNLRDRFGLLPIVHAAKHTNDEIRLVSRNALCNFLGHAAGLGRLRPRPAFQPLQAGHQTAGKGLGLPRPRKGTAAGGLGYC